MQQKSTLRILHVLFIFLLGSLITLVAIALELRHSPYISSVLYFYVIPITVSAYVFGLNTGLFVSFLCCLIYAPLAAKHLSVSFYGGLQEVLSFIIFVLIGLVSGFLSDRLKKEKHHAYFHALLQEQSAEASYNVEQLSVGFLNILKQAADFQSVYFTLTVDGKRIEFHADEKSKAFYAGASAEILAFFQHARQGGKKQLSIFPAQNIKFYSHIPFVSGSEAKGFIECSCGIESDMPSVSTQNLLVSLCDSFITHVNKSLLHQDIQTVGSFLEHLLSIVPFGVIRLDGEGREVYRNAFFMNDDLLSSKVLRLFHLPDAPNELYFSHDDIEFFCRRVLIKTAGAAEFLLMAQSMEEKRAYENAQENYRIRSAFLKHVSDSFFEKISAFEKDVERITTVTEAGFVDEALFSCREMISYVDGLLTEAKKDAQKTT